MIDQTGQTPDSDAGTRRGERLLADLARRAVSGSVGALLSSEDGIKQLIAAIVPKEVGQYVARELALLRSQALEALTGQVAKYLERIDLADEIKDVLSGLNFDIHIRVGVTRRDPSPSDAEVTAPTRGAARQRRKASK